MIINPNVQQSKLNQIQNYSPYRSSEYSRIPNHYHKPYTLNKKQLSSNRLYLRNRTNMTDQDNTQEYSRFRDATFQNSLKVLLYLFNFYI